MYGTSCRCSSKSNTCGGVPHQTPHSFGVAQPTVQSMNCMHLDMQLVCHAGTIFLKQEAGTGVNVSKEASARSLGVLDSHLGCCRDEKNECFKNQESERRVPSHQSVLEHSHHSCVRRASGLTHSVLPLPAFKRMRCGKISGAPERAPWLRRG